MAAAFKYLFTPIRLGQTLLENRIVWTGHGTRFTTDPMPTKRLRDYYTRRARGNVGLIITEASAVMLSGRSRSDAMCPYCDDIIPEYRKIAESVHEYGTKLFVQLTHAGINVYKSFGPPVVGPSKIRSSNSQEFPHELRIDEIEKIVDAFGDAALRVKKSSLDGIELLASQGQLLTQFLSPLINQRTDAYGGSFDKRLRFLLEVVQNVREKIGGGFTLGVRICGDDFAEGGLSLEDSLEIAKRLEGTKHLDYLSVDGGLTTDIMGHCMSIAPMYVPLNYMIHLASNIRRVVNLPIVCVGRINDPLQAEKILADGHADLIGMCRALICDPDFVLKAKQDRIDDIRKCIACNEGCIGRFSRGSSIACIQNPEAGHEAEFADIKPADKVKKVVVIGGGPAGMQAALTSAKRGHHVVLFEKNDALGGQVLIAAMAPFKSEFLDISRFLSKEVKKSGVEVRLGKEADVQSVLAEKPDVVIITTGSVPFIPNIPIKSKHTKVVSVWDVLQGIVQNSRRVVIVDNEGHDQAAGAAEILADKGCAVEILTPRSMIGEFMYVNNRVLMTQRLYEKNVVITPHMDLQAIEDNTVMAYNIYTHQKRPIENIDTVVFAVGNQAKDDLYIPLKDSIQEVYMAGDCIAPRKVFDAIHEGVAVAKTF